jgi:hypothetical protein
MSTDEFQDVARVVSRSWVARALDGGIGAVRTAAVQSFWARAFGRVSRQPIAASTRVRLAGVLLLTTTVTHRLLLELVPAFLRPAAPELLRVEMVLASLVLVVAAPWLGRAWPGSRVRRILATWMS